MISRARGRVACSGRWHRLAGAALAAALVLASGQSGAGHSVGHFPSYYPDEIRIDVVDPEAAAKGLADATVHAYVGAAPKFSGPVPAEVKSLKSLGSLLILSFDAASTRFQSAEARCTAAGGILARLRDGKDAGFVFHPYPVTPYHADYLHHLDRVEAAVGAVGTGSAPPAVAVGAKSGLAQAIVQARLGSVARAADVVLEVVPVDDLISAASVQFSGWTGPPWIKEGWFHAYRLLAPALDAKDRPVAEKAYDRLIHGELRGGLAERVDLERRLVAALGHGCTRVVVGYALREEYFNESYPPGIENIAFDAVGGFNAPVFIRTVKLKEYPWNGKLNLGVPRASDSAWNPVAGFTDPTGRLMWAAVGDPAMIPFPINASWMPNRVQSELAKVEGRSGGIKVPADALRPQPGSGMLKRVGDWAFASEKVTYEVLPSPFGDGTEQAVADLLYPYVFAYRWGDKANLGANAYEPRIGAALAPIRERLVGIKVVRVDQTKNAVAEGMELVVKTPVVEVYLNAAPGDERQVASLAPPWSTVPWHLLALMEEAVVRGYAAFSAEEAARRGVPWLDLVRDRALVTKLQELVAQFEREGYRPAPLKDLVTAEEAQARWRSLRAFAEKNGHFLVANGPYRLKAWTPGSIVLEAVREMTYPLGFGTFDRFVFPPSAVIDAASQDGRSVTVRASAAMTLKGGRGYTPVKEPLLHTTMRGVFPLLVVSRYLLIDAAGKVLKVDKMRWAEDGHFAIDLAPQLPPGDYTVIAGILLDGNAVQPSARVLRVRLGAAGSPG
jgi:hypothetical protein